MAGDSVDQKGMLHAMLKKECAELFALRDPESGLDLMPIFSILPAKRDYPDYYSLISYPVAYSTLKKKLPHYPSAAAWLKDAAYIAWNAKTYNLRGSQVWKFADIIEKHLKNVTVPRLKRVYPEIEYPYLGPLPDENPPLEQQQPQSGQVPLQTEHRTPQPAGVQAEVQKPEPQAHSQQLSEQQQQQLQQQQELILQQQLLQQHQRHFPIVAPKAPAKEASIQPKMKFIQFATKDKPKGTNATVHGHSIIKQETARGTTPVERTDTPPNAATNTNMNMNTSINTNTTPAVPQQAAMPRHHIPMPKRMHSNYELSAYSPPMSQTTTPQPHMMSRKDKKALTRRGRPPMIDLPHIQRMKNIIKGLKKEIDPTTRKSVTVPFEKLPNPASDPVYYTTITDPITFDDIWKRVKTRKYKDMQSFQTDISLMLINYKTAYNSNMDNMNKLIAFEKTFNVLYHYELAKPDKDYIPEGEFRYPIDEITVNNRAYHVGDWVLLANPNDPMKPVVGQIFKLWNTEDGQKWLNACWYFRPEQTVHRVDRLFYKNEVMKTGQYRDHQIEDIVGSCYVEHFTRYQRSEPTTDIGGPLFLCEYRYNESDKVFNKIRTWRACLPEEIRDVEEPCRPVNGRKFFKYVSPISHLLPPNSTMEDPIPEPQMADPNAPPLVGAVYMRPPLQRDDLGEYSTSHDSPRHIIRPGEPHEPGVIDQEMGTITVDSTVNLTQTKPSYSASPSLLGTGTGKVGRPPNSSHHKIHSNAQILQNDFKTTYSSKMAAVTNRVAGYNNATHNNVPKNTSATMLMPITNRMQSNGKQTSKTQVTGPSKKAMEQSYASYIQYAAAYKGNNQGSVIVDTPGAYVLPIDILGERVKGSQELYEIQTADFNSMAKRLTKEEMNLQRKRGRNGEIIWFRSPSVMLGERLLNLGDTHLQTPLNVWNFPDRLGVTDNLAGFDYEEVEEEGETMATITKAAVDHVMSTDDDYNGVEGPATGDSDQDIPKTINLEETMYLDEDDKDDCNDLTGPHFLGLRPSAKYLAYKLSDQ
ncbi:Rsc2p KNAG_0B05830 [Huiozyma naganishii CBS 8797]|uniref:BAH domain-containing protein n=1 Tax=Huiozyma naganishii (strain ATCC MYA-139 / BCRC 22969 / CBS 8797 / KCTC 17520 / NBRC 10181 / NCYC 3082 / Yp74L-3) TaxID=1071383 RepID=J7S419_HUIN7|nr:hypothetical protein KNAG_0B05830 [Kazachstania naganishii CBS 8797]CCK69014.1 hypothetical protein KNAG_0B05830 [Kazachstania naganishii CBS 8797]